MNAIRNIAGRLFAAWAMLLFVITMLPVTLLMWAIGMAKEPRRTDLFRRISLVWMKLFFLLTGCRIRLRGKENFNDKEKSIIICNHNSFMDVMVATPFIPGANKTIAKIEMSRLPLFGLIYKRGSILVDRKDKNSRRDSFAKMKGVLQGGMHMCIYPEGTRNKGSEPLKEFHDGAFKLAAETGRPILPAVLFNTRKVLPADKTFFFWPALVEMHFLPAYKLPEGESYEQAKQYLFRQMSEYYTKHKDLIK
jgi:1-acyl-sn-glycerol-3-phosphate acyltransferase